MSAAQISPLDHLPWKLPLSSLLSWLPARVPLILQRPQGAVTYQMTAKGAALLVPACSAARGDKCLPRALSKVLGGGPWGGGEPLDLGVGDCSQGGAFDLETVSVDVGRCYSGQGEHHRRDTQICHLGLLSGALCRALNSAGAAPSFPLIQILPDYTGCAWSSATSHSSPSWTSVTFITQEKSTHIYWEPAVCSALLSIWCISSLELGEGGWDRTPLTSCVVSPSLLIPDCEGFLTIQHSLRGWQPWPEHGLELGFLELSLD